MALSDFFPYGAPELLDGASARMARSTTVASLAVALLVVAAGAMMPRQVTVMIAPVIPDRIEKFLDVRKLQPPPKSGPIPPEVEIVEPGAKPNPVPEEILKKEIIELVPPSAGPAGEENVDRGPTGQASQGGVIAPTRDPEPGEYVPYDEMPALVRCKEAVYPDLARAAGVEGMVTVRMLVGLNGKVERAIIAPRGSVPMLDQAALDAALTCTFTPALANGHPVKVWVSQNYRFSLHSTP